MKRHTLLLCILLALVLTGCAAGNLRFEDQPAGFWMGLWHGLICVIAFVVSLFNDGVHIYEVQNSGHLYDLGYVIGLLIALGSCGSSCGCKTRKRPRDQVWDEIGTRIETEIRDSIKESLDEEEDKGEWEEIARKVEDKVKRELRTWAES